MSVEFEDIRYAILGEYCRYFRQAELPIGNIYKVTTVIDVPVPDKLTAYVAHTVIVDTPAKSASIFADYAFCLKDEIHVVLHTELHCPGMTPWEMIKLSMDAILEAEDARAKVEIMRMYSQMESWSHDHRAH